jgi:hypothetical protein
MTKQEGSTKKVQEPIGGFAKPSSVTLKLNSNPCMIQVDKEYKLGVIKM